MQTGIYLKNKHVSGCVWSCGLWWSSCTHSMNQASSAVSAGWMIASTSQKDQQKYRGGSGVSSVSFQSVIVPKLLAALPLHRCCSPDQIQKALITVRMYLPV